MNMDEEAKAAETCNLSIFKKWHSIVRLQILKMVKFML